jgi:phosphoglycerate dehydrogenase-like enzyme
VKILFYPKPPAEDLEVLRGAAGDAEALVASTEEEAIEKIVDCDALYHQISPAMLKAARNLRWIQLSTVSMETQIFPELIDHPVEISNIRGVFNDLIADQVMSYILCLARGLHKFIAAQRDRKWIRVDPYSPEKTALDPIILSEQTLGIVGLGGIGTATAERAKAFGMRILATDLRPKERPAFVDRLWTLDGLDEMLAQSDFVAICAGLTPTSQGLFDATRIAKLRPNAYLINIGRGKVVKLGALTAALKENRIAGAALDVFETEPLPSESELWTMPNVIITPHMAGRTAQLNARRLKLVAGNISRYVRGETPINLTDKAAWC